MRALFAGMVLVLAACAPAAPGRGVSSGPTTVIATGDGAYVNLARDTQGSSFRVATAPQPVWTALPAVYRELGIPEGTVDPGSWTYGNRQIVINRKLGDLPLVQLLRCGNTATGAPIAANYRIRMSVLTRLTPVSDAATEVQTAVQATATSNQGTSTDPVVCESTGTLEERIASEIQARVGT